MGGESRCGGPGELKPGCWRTECCLVVVVVVVVVVALMLCLCKGGCQRGRRGGKYVFCVLSCWRPALLLYTNAQV